MPGEERPVSPDLSENIAALRSTMRAERNKDFVARPFMCMGAEACAMFLEGMAGSDFLDDDVLRPLMKHAPVERVSPGKRAGYLLACAIPMSQGQLSRDLNALAEELVNGQTVIFLDGCDEAILLDTRKYDMRPVMNPRTEAVVIGAQEGFVENLRTNITLVRRYLRSSALITEPMSVGTKIPTRCALLYLDGVANEAVVARVRQKIAAIDAPHALNCGALAQLLEPRPFLIFPQILQTERPDRTVAALTGGQVAILMDNAPYALILPTTLFDLLHASDDSFMRWQYGTFLRVIRLLGVLTALYLPALYIAVSTNHSHMIPLKLLTSIAETRVNVPFSILAEVLFMEFAFFLINEAGTRIPTQIGSALGIVGALILGQAAVSASLISPILIIIVALTGLGNYVVPNYSMGVGIQILRLAMILAAAFMGLYGILIASYVLFGRLSAVDCLGIPYLAPVAPWRPHNPDLVARLPIWLQNRLNFYAEGNSWLKKEQK